MAMAKKRTTAKTSTRSHHPHRSGGGEATWKKSKLVAVVLIVVIVVSLLRMIGSGTGNPSLLPDNFPRVFIAAENNGSYENLLVERGAKNPKIPIESDGKKFWDAYICLNEYCPGRKKTGGRPYIFAGVMPEMPPISPEGPGAPGGPGTPPPDMGPGYFPEIVCPECKKMYDTVKPKQKALYEPMNIERYMTDEAKEIIVKIREEHKKRNKQ